VYVEGGLNVKKTLMLPGIVAMVALTVMTSIGPVFAADRQKKKNNWRNLAIGAGVIAGHGLLRHNNTETLIGAAGAAYSASQYEKERKAQSRESAARHRYHRYNGTRYTPRYHRRSTSTYTTGNRKYYTYNGHRYYMNLNTGRRVRLS
jgi:hypothetical protein